MHTRLTTFITTVKGMKSRDFLYFGLSILFCVIIAIFFFLSAKFISNHINKVFAITSGGAISSLDVPRYTLVAEKLKFPPDASAQSGNALEEGATTNASSTTQNTLTLLILNASSKPKVATSMAKILKEKNGFTNIATGSEKTASTTTILAQESKKMYANMILETVVKTYPTARIVVTDKPGKYDIVLTLGTK